VKSSPFDEPPRMRWSDSSEYAARARSVAATFVAFESLT
jgi:hypothetical protein